MILFTIIIATLVAGWLNTMGSSNAAAIANTTTERMNCQYSGIYIDNVVYECNNSCFTGNPYRINVTIKNTGSVSVYISKITTYLSNGITYSLSAAQQKLITGQKIAMSWNSSAEGDCRNTTALDKIVVASTTCSANAYDSVKGTDVTFINCT
jgi:hypothetical protein